MKKTGKEYDVNEVILWLDNVKEVIRRLEKGVIFFVLEKIINYIQDVIRYEHKGLNLNESVKKLKFRYRYSLSTSELNEVVEFINNLKSNTEYFKEQNDQIKSFLENNKPTDVWKKIFDNFEKFKHFFDFLLLVFKVKDYHNMMLFEVKSNQKKIFGDVNNFIQFLLVDWGNFIKLMLDLKKQDCKIEKLVLYGSNYLKACDYIFTTEVELAEMELIDILKENEENEQLIKHMAVAKRFINKIDEAVNILEFFNYSPDTLKALLLNRIDIEDNPFGIYDFFLESIFLSIEPLCIVYILKDLMGGSEQIMRVFRKDKHSDNFYKDNFLEKNRCLRILHNDSIVNSFGEKIEENIIFYQQMSIKGRTLEEISKERKFSLQETLEFLYWGAKTLRYMHTQGVIHQYLHPSNIVLTQEKTFHMIDLGCKLYTHQEELKKHHIDIRFLAPEQIFEMRANIFSDMYSLVAIALYMYTGLLPEDKYENDIKDKELCKFFKIGSHQTENGRFCDDRFFIEQILRLYYHYFLEDKSYLENLSPALIGEENASITMANLSFEGKLLPKNYRMVVDWLDSIAEKGNKTANVILGQVYEHGGYGVNADDYKACSYYEKTDDPYGLFYIAMYYHKLAIIDLFDNRQQWLKNYYEYLVKSYIAGYCQSAYFLGELYYWGGVLDNSTKVFKSDDFLDTPEIFLVDGVSEDVKKSKQYFNEYLKLSEKYAKNNKDIIEKRDIVALYLHQYEYLEITE